jgi:hypothetical protein
MEGGVTREEEQTMVETIEQRKAKKEHEAASHTAGLRATLDAGRIRDTVANMLPAIDTVKSLAMLLEEMVPEAELEDLSREVEAVEVLEEDVQHEAEQEPDKEAEKEIDVDAIEARALLSRLKKLLGEE